MAPAKLRELRLKKIWPEPQKKDIPGGGQLEEPIATLDDVDQVIHGPVRIFDPDGRVQLIAVPIGNTDKFHEYLPKVSYHKAQRSQGLTSKSQTFGYAPRLPIRKHEGCRRAGLYKQSPELSGLLSTAAKGIERVYERELPDEFAAHREETIKRVRPEWRMNGTVFTSGILNRDNVLHYHIDRGNFKDRWSAMLVFRKHTLGGELIFPQWRLAHACNDGLLMIFHGQHWWHGVAPIRLLRKNSYRITAVFYSLRDMWKCLEPKEELARARRVRTERELKEKVLEPRAKKTILKHKSKTKKAPKSK